MFDIINWDTLGDLFLDLLVVLVLCIFLFIWAARVRMHDMQARGEWPPKPSPPRHRPQRAGAAPLEPPAAAPTRNDPPL